MHNTVHVDIRNHNHILISKRFLTDNTFVLRITRNNLQFRAGQHLIVGLKGELDQREYSVYSGENDDYLEILVKEVQNGNISVKLSQCKPGDELQVEGPFGTFGIEPFDLKKKQHIFIATGTGISPFHSMIRSYPGINYTLIHGVTAGKEAYEKDEYNPERYFICTSREKGTGYNGRVTSYLNNFKVSNDMLFYLCGNGSMIYEVKHILGDKGVMSHFIFTEVYF